MRLAPCIILLLRLLLLALTRLFLVAATIAAIVLRLQRWFGRRALLIAT
jgi:hypothetical protein